MSEPVAYEPKPERPPRPPLRLGAVFRWLVLACLVVALVSYVMAPWMAFRALRSAALSADVRAMTELMDVGAVRAGLRAQRASGARQGPAPSFLDDPAGALDSLLGGRLQSGPTDVEGLMTPNAIAHFSHAQGRSPGQPFRAGDLLPGLHGSEIRYWGPDRVRIAALAPGDSDAESLFTFERRGFFKWRLTHIRLPAPVERQARPLPPA